MYFSRHRFSSPPQSAFEELERLLQVSPGWDSDSDTPAQGAPTPEAVVLADDDHYYIQMELPGVRREEISLVAMGGGLFLRASRDANNVLREPGFSYHFAFRLPEDVDSSGLAAHLGKGLLQVTLPRIPQNPVDQN